MKNDFVSEGLRRALHKKPAAWVRLALTVLATLVFYQFAYHARYATLDTFGSYQMGELMTMTAVIFTAVYFVMLAVQMAHAKTLPMYMYILIAVLTGVIVLAKVSLLDYVSDDYAIFLNDWISSYTTMNLKEGLGTYIGSDYTPPYLYFMYAISRFPDYPWLYMVKAISLFAEILMAYAIMKLSSFKAKGEGAQLLVFHIALMLPTVMFNGAYWGQCDALYSAFCLLAVYLCLAKKPCRGMVAFGVAISFKLQTVFFLPMLLPLWYRKNVKLRHLLIIPCTYMAMMVPALWGGKSLHHVLTCYMQQAGQYNFMTVNAPSLYQFLPLIEIDGHVLYKMFSPMAMALGVGAIFACCAPVAVYHKKLTPETTLLFGVLVLSCVPFFLPKMHERYTFGADVLSLALCVWAPRRIVLPLLFGLASYICYTAGLPGDSIFLLKWASFFQLTGIVLVACELVRTLRADDGAVEVKA